MSGGAGAPPVLEPGRGRLCVCVAGWHFRPDVFAALADVQRAYGADVFVVSHRPMVDVPAALAGIPPERVLVRPNVGYDWGCYQQFVEAGHWRGYDDVFFMHDDVEVRDIGFVPASLELLRAGARFVGNGRNAARDDWPATHPHCYAHAAVRPPGPAFRHATIRGSFLATTRRTLAELGAFEVFWDPFHLSDRFGNWSVIASSGRMAVRFGPDCLAFLADTYLQSPYLVELVRGAQPDPSAGPADASSREPMSIAIQVVLSRWAMRLYWARGGGTARSIGLAALGSLAAIHASRRFASLAGHRRDDS